MAYVWHMTATFEDEVSAKRFRDHFCMVPFSVPSGEVRLSAGVEKHSEWECSVLPTTSSGEHLNGHGGPADEREAADLEEAGNVLYRRLRHAPPFLRAVCGVEVSDWLSHGEFLGRASDLVERPEAYHGLVLSDSLHRVVGSPASFVPFGDGTVWIPWRGPRVD